MNITNINIENCSITAKIGVELREADGITMKNVYVAAENGPALTLRNVKNLKPGPAISTDSHRSSRSTCSRIFAATSRGFSPRLAASFRAMLHWYCPNSGRVAGLSSGSTPRTASKRADRIDGMDAMGPFFHAAPSVFTNHGETS